MGKINKMYSKIFRAILFVWGVFRFITDWVGGKYAMILATSLSIFGAIWSFISFAPFFAFLIALCTTTLFMALIRYVHIKKNQPSDHKIPFNESDEYTSLSEVARQAYEKHRTNNEDYYIREADFHNGYGNVAGHSNVINGISTCIALLPIPLYGKHPPSESFELIDYDPDKYILRDEGNNLYLLDSDNQKYTDISLKTSDVENAILELNDGVYIPLSEAAKEVFTELRQINKSHHIIIGSDEYNTEEDKLSYIANAIVDRVNIYGIPIGSNKSEMIPRNLATRLTFENSGNDAGKYGLGENKAKYKNCSIRKGDLKKLLLMLRHEI